MKEKKGARTPVNRKNIIFIVVTIIIVATITLVFPSIILKKMTNGLVAEVTQNISKQYSQELNTQMSSHVLSTLEHRFDDLNVMGDTLALIEDLDEEKLKSFTADAQRNISVSYLAFVDEDGYVYTADGSYLGTTSIHMMGKLLSGEARVMNDNETIGGESYITMGIAFTTPVPMGDTKIVAGILGLSNDELSADIVLSSEYSGGYSNIIHKDGSYVVKNPASTLAGLNVFAVLEKDGKISEEEGEVLRDMVDKNLSYMTVASDVGNEETVYLYFAPIEGTEWYIVNVLPGSFIRSSVSVLQKGLTKSVTLLSAAIVAIGTVVIVILGITAGRLRRSKEEVERALGIAEDASNAKTTFLFNMSHDIRTPMNAILGYADIGLRHVEDIEKSRDSYQKIKTAGGHLLNLINDVLEMSRVESGRMELVEAPLDVRQAVSTVNHMSQSLADAKDIHFKTVIGSIKDPYILADELHINEVIINLISNAVKYTQSGGDVTYSVSQISNVMDGKVTYRFEIADNGIGMSEEFQRHLFEAFSREANSTVSKVEGTGIGLSIVKKIVDLAGGTIHVKSVQNLGSTFTVEIPFTVMDNKAIAAFKAEHEEEDRLLETITLEGRRILLVEDNEMNREIAEEILGDAGLVIESAENGEIAVRCVLEKPIGYYDAILMDIQMPVMDGYEATKAIRALPGRGTVPIIALSANAFEEDKKKSLEHGMNAHIAKPIDIKLLLDTLHTMLR